MQCELTSNFEGRVGTDMFSELRVYIKQLLFFKKIRNMRYNYRSINFLYLLVAEMASHGSSFCFEGIVSPQKW